MHLKQVIFLFPDEMAKQIEAAYQSFSDNVIMVDFSE
jgi:hypothetical protein